MPADPADYVDRFTSAEVCAAANITPATLKNWVSRRPAAVLLTKEDQVASAKGSPIRYSFNRVMQIAITAELVRMGWQPRPAAMLAVQFSDLGFGPLGDQPGRDPGELFPTGRTVLIADTVPADDCPGGKCIRVDDSTPLCSVLYAHPAAVVVDVSRIWMTVRVQLGLPRS
jgi:hypothetical protein